MENTESNESLTPELLNGDRDDQTERRCSAIVFRSTRGDYLKLLDYARTIDSIYIVFTKNTSDRKRLIVSVEEG